MPGRLKCPGIFVGDKAGARSARRNGPAQEGRKLGVRDTSERVDSQRADLLICWENLVTLSGAKTGRNDGDLDLVIHLVVHDRTKDNLSVWVDYLGDHLRRKVQLLQSKTAAAGHVE